MADTKDKTYCYLDHANKKSENFGANPYLFWLNQVRRERAESRARQERLKENLAATQAKSCSGG